MKGNTLHILGGEKTEVVLASPCYRGASPQTSFSCAHYEHSFSSLAGLQLKIIYLFPLQEHHICDGEGNISIMNKLEHKDKLRVTGYKRPEVTTVGWRLSTGLWPLMHVCFIQFLSCKTEALCITIVE